MNTPGAINEGLNLIVGRAIGTDKSAWTEIYRLVLLVKMLKLMPLLIGQSLPEFYVLVQCLAWPLRMILWIIQSLAFNVLLAVL